IEHQIVQVILVGWGFFFVANRVGLRRCRSLRRGAGQGFFSFVVAGGAVDVESVGVVVTAMRGRHRLQWSSSPMGQWMEARSSRVWVREMEAGSLGEGDGWASRTQSVLGFHQFNCGAVMLAVGWRPCDPTTENYSRSFRRSNGTKCLNIF
ncbi:hypothetical protein Dimus_018222, partial [Dionaea muscipula]